MTLIYILIANIIVSFASLIGILFLFLNRKLLDKILFVLVSIATGALIGGAFLHLLPHSLEYLKPFTASWVFIFGFVLFFVLEKILRWRHCHEWECEIHPVSYLNLIGDGLHNFIDGVIIAVSFMVSVEFGVITTLIVLAHEVPQEIGDFAILVFGGMDRIKALLFNFVSALTAVLGGLFGYFFLKTESLIPYIMAFAAGNFFYISATDLIPELHKEPDMKKSISSFFLFISGIFLMYVLKIMFRSG